MKKYLPLFAAGLFAAALAFGGPITTWVSGDIVTANDLTANFTHIHASMVGGHGPRLMNSDVNANAAISHSKLATPALVPKVWAYASSCLVSPCTVSDSSGVSTITRSDAGVYSVVYSAARANAAYAAITSAVGPTQATCQPGSPATANSPVYCFDHDGGLTDSAFSFLLLDSN